MMMDQTSQGSERIVDFRYAPKSVWTAICRPDDPYKTLVDEQGRLLYDFQGLGFRRAVRFRVQTDDSPIHVTQVTESARLPIVKTTLEYPQVTLELTSFGHLHEGRRTDVVLWSIHTQEESFMTHFQIEIQENGVEFHHRNEGDTSLVFSADLSGDHSGEGESSRVEVVSTHSLERGYASDYGPTISFKTKRALVKPGYSLSGAVMIPLNHQETSDLNETWANQALENERRFWNELKLLPLKLEVPDEGIMDMYTSCARNILQARENKVGLPEFQVGPTLYRGLWVVDGHFILEAAWYLGHAEEAFNGLEALLRRAKPDGSIYQAPHHMKETGIALATLVRQCELKGDMEKLKGLWPVVRRAVDYINRLREESKKRGPGAPEYGLFPPAYGDGGLGGKRPEYTTTLWMLVGLKSIMEAAERIGYADDANYFRKSYESLLTSFWEHAGNHMKLLPDGTPYLPMLMPCGSEYVGEPTDTTGDLPGIPENPWQRVTPATATWALAHSIYPGEVFQPGDEIVRNFCHLLDLIDDEEGIPTGTGWAPYQAIWNYSASFYAHVWLYAGKPEKAVDYLYSFANHASPTRVWREEHPFQRTHHGYWVGDMPHNWASAEFIRLVRNLLVFEAEDRVEIFKGLPVEWIIPEKGILVEKTPTRYGPISVTMNLSTEGELEINIVCDPSWPKKPVECRFYLTALKKAGLLDIWVNGIQWTDMGDVLILPEGESTLITGTIRQYSVNPSPQSSRS